MENLKRILEVHPFVLGLAPRHVELIVGCAANVRFPAGAYIGREGERADQFYVIREGKVALEIHAPPRGTISIQTLEDGDVLGWSWLVIPYRWRFDIRAVLDTRAIALDGACLRTKCQQDHELGYELMNRIAHIIEQRLNSTRLQLIDMYSKVT